MGEISEMMMEGILCQCCGVFLGDGEHPEKFEPIGVPTFCGDCKPSKKRKKRK